MDIMGKSAVRHISARVTGPAGTGKTTLLKVLLEQTSIVGREVLLLAPTGKARVRLGQQTRRPDQARTLAQFLLEHERYDGSTGRYFANASGPTASVSTCVVDESSMLTEDQLAALCSALHGTDAAKEPSVGNASGTLQ